MAKGTPAQKSFDDFLRVTDPAVYAPVPADWIVGVTDVVGSTKAIEAGRYKAVNMAGASAISAVKNALGGAEFPFAFGGDGAGFAVAAGHRDGVERALARTVRWTREELGLELRAALVPVEDILATGHKLLIANYAPSSAVRYAMFSGGGIEWAEEQLKEGRYSVEPAPPGARPDLTGLSCRWKPMPAQSGLVLSVIVRRAPDSREDNFTKAVSEILALVSEAERDGHPVPASGPDFGSPLMGLGLEASAARPSGAGRLWTLRLFAWRIFAWLVVKSGLTVGGFQAAHYRGQTVLNSDFRKFHDGLNLTLDCTSEQADRIEALLQSKEDAGAIRYGVFRQDEALMTCIVPSYAEDDHFHFIDGAKGGYAEAARRLKAL